MRPRGRVWTVSMCRNLVAARTTFNFRSSISCRPCEKNGVPESTSSSSSSSEEQSEEEQEEPAPSGLGHRENETRFPHFAALAGDLLGPPGSTATLERTFSHWGRALNKRRAPRLEPDMACDIIINFWHENIVSGHF